MAIDHEAIDQTAALLEEARAVAAALGFDGLAEAALLELLAVLALAPTAWVPDVPAFLAAQGFALDDPVPDLGVVLCAVRDHCLAAALAAEPPPGPGRVGE